MDEQSVGVRAGNVGRAAARGFVATALTLSLVPSLAYASPTTEEETAPQATNSEAISPLSDTPEGASNKNYSYDLSKIADGTYSGTAIASEEDQTTTSDEWDAEGGQYEVAVSVTVASGKITKVEVADYSKTLGDNDWERMDRAENGYENKRQNINFTGVVSQIETNGNTSNIDTVSTATVSSNAIIKATNEALQAAYDDQNKSTDPETPVEDECTYGYAGLTWAQYWAAEGVQNATDVSSSDELDSKGETDKGGYDVVSRATTNHGLHRGSYQCTTTIYCSDGTSYGIAAWASDGKSFTSTDGKTIGYSKGTLTTEDGAKHTLAHYEVAGLKYVPVAVKTTDLDDFKSKFTFVANDETLTGGYSENKLSAYSVTAAVDADTYGLKTATKSGESYSFSKASTTGTTSGIKDQDLKTASGIEPSVHAADGAYGEFLRVDLNGNYGDLGANMQAVTWTYYGDDSTRSNAVATFGTKFAADNWMHKSMGIQLGLTHSQRCQLPADSDGTGYWTITVHALGYSDYSWDFEATSENIAVDTPATQANVDSLQALYDEGAAKQEGNYTAAFWASFKTELDETKELLDKKGEPTEVEDSKGNKSNVYNDITNAAVLTQIQHLQDAIDSLVRTAPEAGSYVLMNIPYDEFYAAETTNNNTKVDVFTSATKNKVRTGSLAGGSYHKDSTGDEISGITYAVKISDDAAEKIDWSKYAQITDDSSVDVTVTNRGKTSTTTYKGKDALFEADTYSYYILSDAPTSYKELSVDSEGKLQFGALQGAAATEVTETVNTVSDLDSADIATQGAFSTNSTYGDYEINLSQATKTAIGENATVYAVLINTEEGESYGLRHLENIWRVNELSWCSTTLIPSVHNCPTSYEHYADLMGQNITSITYYTSNGTFQVNLAEKLYVPVKSSDSKLSVMAETDAATATVQATLPFTSAQYSVDGTNVDVTVGNDLTSTTGTFDISNLSVGSHELVASDTEGKCADVATTFSVSTSKAVAQVKDSAVVKADGASDDDLSNYLGNITSVSVNGKAYAVSGRGSVPIVNKDGSINTNATSNNAKVFDGYGDYAIEITSTGYPTLSGTMTLEAEKTSLNDAIAKAEAQATEGFTNSSIAAFQEAYEAAKKVAADKTATDDAVAQAASNLTSAQAALAAKATDEDREALQGNVDKASALKESDYTASSWKNLQTALAAAKAALENDDASQDELTSADTALSQAVQSLKAAGTDDEADQSGSTTTTTTTTTTDKAAGTPKTGDDLTGVAGGVAAVAAAAAGAAAWARRKFMQNK